VSAISGKGDDAVLLIADPTTCGAAFTAAKSLAFNKDFYTPVECNSDANDKLVSGLSQKVYNQQISESLEDTSDPDVTAYKQASKDAKVDDSTANNQFTISGFQTVMNVYATAKKAAAAGDVSSAGLVKAVKAGGIHQFLMGADTTFTCDGTALPALPALCSLNTLIGTWKGTDVTDVKPINGADALK
jgi:branched-chain amino acid transport system substrate-binding protein